MAGEAASCWSCGLRLVSNQPAKCLLVRWPSDIGRGFHSAPGSQEQTERAGQSRPWGVLCALWLPWQVPFVRPCPFSAVPAHSQPVTVCQVPVRGWNPARSLPRKQADDLLALRTSGRGCEQSRDQHGMRAWGTHLVSSLSAPILYQHQPGHSAEEPHTAPPAAPGAHCAGRQLSPELCCLPGGRWKVQGAVESKSGQGGLRDAPVGRRVQCHSGLALSSREAVCWGI